MQTTWYVLEDGSPVDPAEVSPRADGRLVHASGKLIAMRSPDCPMTRGVDPAQYARKDVTADRQEGGYKTRQAKAR